MRMRRNMATRSPGTSTGGSSVCPLLSEEAFFARFSSTRKGLESSCGGGAGGGVEGPCCSLRRAARTHSGAAVAVHDDECNAEGPLGVGGGDHEGGAAEVRPDADGVQGHVHVRQRPGGGGRHGRLDEALRRFAVKVDDFHPHVLLARVRNALVVVLPLCPQLLGVRRDALAQLRVDVGQHKLDGRAGIQPAKWKRTTVQSPMRRPAVGHAT